MINFKKVSLFLFVVASAVSGLRAVPMAEIQADFELALKQQLYSREVEKCEARIKETIDHALKTSPEHVRDLKGMLQQYKGKFEKFYLGGASIESLRRASGGILSPIAGVGAFVGVTSGCYAVGTIIDQEICHWLSNLAIASPAIEQFLKKWLTTIDGDAAKAFIAKRMKYIGIASLVAAAGATVYFVANKASDTLYDRSIRKYQAKEEIEAIDRLLTYITQQEAVMASQAAQAA